MDILISFLETYSSVYKESRLRLASAALAYYLTMTVFPLLICLYTMLGNSYESVMRIIRLASGILAPEIISLIEEFLNYVSSNNSNSMLLAGLVLLVSYASSAVRSIHATLYSLQGGAKFEGVRQYAASIVFSLVFLAAIYFAVVVMLSGRQFVETINIIIPWLNISRTWVVLRFIVLAGIFYTLLWGIYEAPKRTEDTYGTMLGAIAATILVLAITVAFSLFIKRSANYPLVYGSLASIILLMLWLYMSCTAIYGGAALNIVLRDMRAK